MMDSGDYKMDLFIERLITRKKDMNDYFQISAAIFAGLIIIFVGLFVKMPAVIIQFMPFVWLGILYGIYRFIRTKNIEFEYAVTNGDMDIDRIIAQRKRKRIFSGHSRNYEIVARMDPKQYTQRYSSIQNKIYAVSSMKDEDVFFLVSQYKGERTIVFFQPDEKMLRSFKPFIPNKIFQ